MAVVIFDSQTHFLSLVAGIQSLRVFEIPGLQLSPKMFDLLRDFLVSCYILGTYCMRLNVP